MKLTTKDKASKLFQAFGSGLINQEDIIKLVDTRKVELGAHLHWTLEQFSTIAEQASDIKIVEYLLNLEKSKLPKWKQFFFKTNALKISVKKYLETLKLAKDSIEDINTAISNIKQPKLSDEMLSAGFGSLNFGLDGIADVVGAYIRLDSPSVYSLQMHYVISVLARSAAIKVCEKRHQDAMDEKSKLKK